MSNVVVGSTEVAAVLVGGSVKVIFIIRVEGREDTLIIVNMVISSVSSSSIIMCSH